MTNHSSRRLFNESGNRHVLRIHAYGTREATEYYVFRMQQLGFSEVHEWSDPIPMDQPSECLRLLTKLVRIE